MNEREIVSKIKRLKAVLPSSFWKKEAQSKITGGQNYFHFLRNDLSVFFSQQVKRPVFAMAILVLLLIFGSFIGLFSGNPGQAPSLSDSINGEQNANYYLSIAEKDLDEISAVSTQERTINREKVEKVNRAIKMASQKLPKSIKSAKETAQIVEKVASISKKAQSVMAAVADVSIDTQDLTQKTTEMVENGIKETTEELIVLFEKTSLNEDQKILFEEAKKNFKQGFYQQTLEHLLRMTNNVQ